MAPTQTPARDAVLVKYLNSAFAKEKQLETDLAALIGRAQEHKALKKGLQDHLKVTKNQSRELQKRIKALGGKAEAGSQLPATDAVAGVRGAPGEAGTMLRDVRDALWHKADEVAHYHVIHTVAERLRDRETASLAKRFRREEERMQSFLGRQIKTLVGEVVKDEVPASERRSSSTRRRASSSRSASTRKTAAQKAGTPRTRKAASSSAKSTAKSARTTAKKAGTTAKKTTRATRSSAKRTAT